MPKYVQLHVQLRHTEVWRRLQLRESSSFADLHDAIQRAFGWGDYHLWKFERDRKVLAAHGAYETLQGRRPPKAQSVKLYRHLGRKGLRCEYEYDFGDSWIHDVVVEDKVELPRKSPWLLDGKGSAPPEDCGGIPGYMRLLEIRRTGKDPWGDDSEELIEWAGDWSPDSFDRAQLPV